MVARPPKSLNYNLCCRTEIQSLLTSSELRPVGVCCVLLWGLRTQHGAVHIESFLALSITTTFGLCLDPLSRSRTLIVALHYGHRRSQQLPGWLQEFVTSTAQGMEAAQRNADVAREQAAKQAEQHAQLLAEQDKRHKEQLQAILDRLQPAIGETASPSHGSPPGQAASPASSSAASPSSRTAAQPPTKLAPGSSLREFRAWRASWEDFFELSDGARLPRDRQKALLRTCLTTEMRATLAHAIPVEESATVGELLDAIGTHFRRQRNIALSCVQFEERKQQHSEPFDRFFVGLKELAADADLCATCLDARLITRIMSGVRSEALRKKLLAINPFPVLKDVLALCRAEESAEHTDADLTSKPSVNAASRSRRP